MLRLVLFVLLTLSLAVSGNAHAQDSCADPFAGEHIQFSAEFWTQTDFCTHSVPYSEFMGARASPLGKPVIDDPTFVSVAAAQAWLQPQSPVVSLEIDGKARAYPLNVLVWHEIVNDELGGIPVAVTWCPLCNSSAAFIRQIDGQTLQLGLTGNLRHSNLVMWDTATQSWWQQLGGDALVGAFTGAQLQTLPSHLVNFGAFARQYPDGEVLSQDTGFDRAYGTTPYTFYDTSPRPFFFQGALDERLPAFERVLAGLIDGQPIAYPFTLLETERVVNAAAGQQELAAFWQAGMASALDFEQIDASRDVGVAALYSRVLDDGRALTFSVDEDGHIRDDQTASLWNIFGVALEGQLAGARLQQQDAAVHLWFVWAAFQPESAIFGQS